MDVHQKRLKFISEEFIIMGTAEPPLLTELEKSDRTNWATHLVEARQLIGSFPNGKMLGQ
ncbi:hypothetical protein [Bythopirellula goksoeyrii]|uniref:hypothetical protein n=1 Tax=Bythopirellula goksoeyrii TaxID=1400387 RepID=UPI001EE524D4|nr:hypothetical protein [Bythopirellula goksoeyrii]